MAWCLFPLYIGADLELRLLKVADADRQFALLNANRAHIGRWEPWALSTTRDDQWRFLHTCLGRYAHQQGFACGIWFNNQLVGVITAALEDTGAMELSYWLDQAHSGQGILTRAIQRFIDLLQCLPEVERLVLVIAEPNATSRSVAARLGFVQQPMPASPAFIEGQWVQRLTYSYSAPDS